MLANTLVAAVLLPLSFPAFDADHAGTAPGALVVTAAWSDAHGLVVNDGVCTYAASGKLGCFDPAATGAEPACARPEVAPDGVFWLELHGATFAPFAAGPDAAVRADLPLWAFDHARLPGRGDYLAWGMSRTEARQELWSWDPASGETARVMTGPAAMSGGVARWPSEPDCLALTTFVPTGGDDYCDGDSTVWKWCAGEPAALTRAAGMRGCSGRIEIAGDAVWNLRGSAASVLPLAGGEAREYVYPADALAHTADDQGRLVEVRFAGGRLRAYDVTAD